MLVFNQDCQGVLLQEVLVIRIWRKCLSFHKIMFVRIMFMVRIIERLVYFYRFKLSSSTHQYSTRARQEWSPFLSGPLQK